MDKRVGWLYYSIGGKIGRVRVILMMMMMMMGRLSV